MKQKLLLHICCAPCSASAVKMLQEKFDISFYWYNPNIYDKEEYEKRKESAHKYAKSLGINFFEEDNFVYDYNGWLSEGGENCDFCYKTRLEKTAEFAKNNNFDIFTTSLLSSPYQKHDLIAEVGKKSAHNNNMSFLYIDFRPAFYDGKNLLRKEGYYIQKYCGCNKSYIERFGLNEAK